MRLLSLGFLILAALAGPATAQIGVGALPPDNLGTLAAQYRDTAAHNRVIVQAPMNDRLAQVIAANNRRSAATRIASVAIGRISENPAQMDAIVNEAFAAAPDLRDELAAQLSQAFPFFVPRIQTMARGAQGARGARGTRAATGGAPAVGDRMDIELAEVDSADDTAVDDDNDPLEGMNRAIFFFNDTLDTYLFRPVAWTYGKIVPNRAKQSVRHFVRNLKAPIVLANDLLQLEFRDAGVTLTRFLVNSTLGLGGLFEVAEDFGFPHHDSDLGQTLNSYGVGAGPYLMLPVFGPATVRHGVGQFVDAFFDPLTYYLDPSERLILGIGKALVRREEILKQLDELRKTSIDYYAAIRSLYYQDRAKFLRRGKPPETRELDRLFESAE